MSATFFDKDDHILARAVLAPVCAEERAKHTGFVQRRATGAVPPKAARVTVRLDALVSNGANDGYADELSLLIRKR